MHTGVIYTALVGWVILTAMLFRFVDKKRAVMVGVLGGFLVLPTVTMLPWQLIAVDRGVAIGMGLWLGIVLFDRRVLRGARPRWVDAPMMLMPAAVIVSWLSNGVSGDDAKHAMWLAWIDAWSWLAVWGAGRLYFSSAADLRRLLVAVVIAGLLYVPVCVFEMIVGPGHFVAQLVYGLTPNAEQAARLGGWRPTGMLRDGLELCAFMAIATVASFACWRVGKAARLWNLPAWLPMAILLITTLACRGVYGYALLLIGLAALFVMHLTSDRVVLVVLLCGAALYIVLRLAGLGADTMLDVAEHVQPSRIRSLAFRLDAERTYVDQVREHNPALGFGGATPDQHPFADGWWVQRLRDTGLVGVAVWFIAIAAVPVGVTAARLLRPADYPTPAITAAGLALLITLLILDGLHNATLLHAAALAGGALVTATRARGRSRARR
ncbi:MAG: hypothetical protein GC159_14575 [Phycisphaera sp.]|nr:hypothetical protein [Phycisphaera sp.]